MMCVAHTPKGTCWGPHIHYRNMGCFGHMSATYVIHLSGILSLSTTADTVGDRNRVCCVGGNNDNRYTTAPTKNL